MVSSVGYGDLERYTIQRKLGEGGMGVVYLARDNERGTEVALKTLSRMSPAALYRFKHEFRALADIRHPNLVSLHELVAAPGQWFFAMELVEGTPFTRHVRGPRSTSPTPRAERPTLVLRNRGEEEDAKRSSGLMPRDLRRYGADEERLRPCLAQLCEAVDFLHQQGMLHRDIKPSNVLVTREGRVVVLDFGLVRDGTAPAEELTPEVAMIGTPGYMAPEQVLCWPATPAADWYAVGTILFEALTGRLPFEGSVEEILGRKRAEPAPPPSAIVDDVPEDLDRLCVDLLQTDPERRPTGREILERIDRRAANPSIRPSSVPPPPDDHVFIGRQSQLAALEAAFEAVGPSEPVLVRVSGGSGMGKTTVVRRFLDGLVSRDEVVLLRGRCYERESVPFKAFDDLVDALSRYLRRLPSPEAVALMPRDVQVLARIFPVLLRADAVASSPRRDLDIHDDRELRRRAFSALKELFARIADRQRLVIHIDDLQWGDVDSVDLLGELLAAPDAPAALVLIGHRTEGAVASEALTALARLEGGEHGRPPMRNVEVGPLSIDESVAMLRALLEHPDVLSDERLREIAAESEGIPFFIEAFARHVNDGGGEGSIHLEDVLGSRIALLSAPARRVLEVVAASGRPVSRHVVRKAAGLGEDTDEAVSALRAANLLWTQGARSRDLIETYHERIREYVVSTVPAPVLRDRHRALAVALRQDGDADHEAIAHHFEAAGDRAQAVFHAVEAARNAAEALAFDRAARLYRFALVRLPADDPRRLELEEGLADALRNGGQAVEAGRAFVRAARLATGELALEYRRCAAEQLIRSGHVDEALQVGRPLLRAVGLRLPENRWQALANAMWLNVKLRLRGLHYTPRSEDEVDPELLRRVDICWSLGHGLVAVNAVEAGDLVTRSALLALQAGEPRRVAVALAFQAALMVLIGVEGASEMLDAAEKAAERAGDRYASAVVTGIRGLVAHLEDGDLQTNFDRMKQAESILRNLNRAANFEVSTTQFQMLASLFYFGRWGELSARFPGCVREAEGRGDLYGAATQVLLYGDVPALLRDDPEEGSRLVESYLARWRERESDLQVLFGLVSRIRLRAYEGRADDILEQAERRVRAAQRAGLLRGRWMRVLMLEGRARAALVAAQNAPDADRRRLLRRAEADVRGLGRSRHPIGEALSDMLAGCVALGRRDPETARAALLRAETRFRKLQMELHMHCSRRLRSRIEGGDAGLEGMLEADEFMRAQGMAAPERIARMLAPHE
ncbi:MAG: serine/threonine-protein kinase PknK [Myxococcota bacterium]